MKCQDKLTQMVMSCFPKNENKSKELYNQAPHFFFIQNNSQNIKHLFLMGCVCVFKTCEVAFQQENKTLFLVPQPF